MILDNFIKNWNTAHHGSFKDYFVPHEGNGFKPHSLHPKRIVFHAASVVAVKVIVVIFAVVFPLSAWMTPDMAIQQSKKIISLTNELRGSLNLPVLQENQKLNQAAASKAQDMLLNQYFAHISPQNIGLDYFLTKVNYKYAVAGENLAMGFNTPEEVVAAWKQSPTHYANMTDPDFSQIGVAMVEGNFKTVDSTLVAQYFGAPDSAAAEVAQAYKPAPSAAKPVSTEKKNVLAYKEVASPIVNQKNTKITLAKTPDKKIETVQVQAYLAPSTKKAEAIVGNTKIPLQQNQTEPQKWTGAAVTAAEPIAPASIITTSTAGITSVTDIDQSNILPKQVTSWEQYFFFKNNPNQALENIFNISSLYFKIILLLAIISILLNIFIEIKKQHPHLIASGAGLIALLVIFIAF
jgi:uncharacterized protein YkwD